MKIRELAKYVGGYCCTHCLDKKATLIVVLKKDGRYTACATCHDFSLIALSDWDDEFSVPITKKLLNMILTSFEPKNEFLKELLSNGGHINDRTESVAGLVLALKIALKSPEEYVFATLKKASEPRGDDLLREATN